MRFTRTSNFVNRKLASNYYKINFLKNEFLSEYKNLRICAKQCPMTEL